MVFFETLLYFIITIFVLVSIHEFGHFIAARLFGMHVPVYSIGMGRRILGFNKLKGFTFGPLPEEIENKLGANTDYRLSLLPIGGYARIAGMIDETQMEEMSGPPKPWEFRSKSWWKKSIVICAGVILNFLLAGAIFVGLKYSEGKIFWDTTTIGYVTQNSVSAKLGVQSGDKIIAVSGKPVSNWQDAIQMEVIVEHFGKDFTMTLERGGQRFDVQYKTAELTSEPSEIEKRLGLFPEGAGGAFIKDITASYPAERIGMKAGDRVVKINDIPVMDQNAMIEMIRPHAAQPVSITWIRNDQPMTATVTPNEAGQIGVQIQPAPFMGKTTKLNYSLGEAISVGTDDLFTRTGAFIRGIFLMFSGKVDISKNVGGPIKIAQMSQEYARGGLAPYLEFMALLSISLAFLNILPIPALDGGHLVIILIEAVLGREISQKIKLNFQRVGVTLLLGLMAFMVFNDIRGL